MRMHVKSLTSHLKFAANAFLSGAEFILKMPNFTLPAYLISKSIHTSFNHEVIAKSLSSTVIEEEVS